MQTPDDRPRPEVADELEQPHANVTVRALTEYRVVDVRPQVIVPAQIIEASSPQAAARSVLGIDVGDRGRRSSLVCRVYWSDQAGLSMVRLYAAPRDAAAPPPPSDSEHSVPP